LHYRLKERKRLTTTGPYAFVRNPIYIANTILLLALCVLSELVWFMPLMLLWCIFVYRKVVAYEEVHLCEKYGDAYRDFLQQIPRWKPQFRERVPAHYGNLRAYLWPSVLAEVHCVLLLIPFALKEFMLD
jgi:hypothetical protein